MSARSLPPGECLQTGIALRAALVLAGLAAGKLMELVEQLAQGVPGDDRLAASEAHSCAGSRELLLALIEVADGDPYGKRSVSPVVGVQRRLGP